jgi:methyl-accepting chemotaxis protein
MERAEERFVSFAGSVSRSIEMMDAFQRGSGGVVDKMTAMAQASRLLQMGLVQTPDEMEKIVEMATRLGKQTDDVSTRMEDFGALLANQSMPRLDNFGISSGRVRQRIEELQKAMPGMTRETAFLQAVMEEGSISLEKLGERADDTLTSLEQLASAYTNLKIAIGKAIAPSMAFIARDAASWLDSTEKTGDEMADIADLFSGFIKLIYMSTAGLTATFKIMAGALAGIAAMILAIPALFGSAAATAAAQSLLESAAEFGRRRA